MHAREAILGVVQNWVRDTLAHSPFLTLARLCHFSHNVYITAEPQPQLHTAFSHIGARAYCITAKHLRCSSVLPNTSIAHKKHLPLCHRHHFTR